MKINAKDLRSLIRGGSEEDGSKHPMVGKYVIARCRDAGVHAGVVMSTKGREVHLSRSRRLWRWKPASGKFLSAVALYGLDHGWSDLRIGETVGSLYLSEYCELIETTDDAQASIEDAPDA